MRWGQKVYNYIEYLPSILATPHISSVYLKHSELESVLEDRVCLMCSMMDAKIHLQAFHECQV